MGTPNLLITKGAPSATLPVGADPITIGRDKSNKLSVPDDDSMSRLHARVFLDGGDLRIVDEGSMNGIFVNGQKAPEAKLRDGDAIRVGGLSIRVVWPADAPAKPGTGGAHVTRVETPRDVAIAAAPPRRSLVPYILGFFVGALVLILLLSLLVGEGPATTKLIYPTEGAKLSNGVVIEWEAIAASHDSLSLQLSTGAGWRTVGSTGPGRNWVALDTRLWPDSENARLQICPRNAAHDDERAPASGTSPSPPGASPEPSPAALCTSPRFEIRNPARWQAWSSDDLPTISADVPLVELGEQKIIQAERACRDESASPSARYRAILLLKQAAACLRDHEPERAAHAKALLRDCQRDLKAAIDATTLALEDRIQRQEWPAARELCRALMAVVDFDAASAEFLAAQRYLKEFDGREER